MVQCREQCAFLHRSCQRWGGGGKGLNLHRLSRGGNFQKIFFQHCRNRLRLLLVVFCKVQDNKTLSFCTVYTRVTTVHSGPGYWSRFRTGDLLTGQHIYVCGRGWKKARGWIWATRNGSSATIYHTFMTSQMPSQSVNNIMFATATNDLSMRSMA